MFGNALGNAAVGGIQRWQVNRAAESQGFGLNGSSLLDPNYRPDWLYGDAAAMPAMGGMDDGTFSVTSGVITVPGHGDVRRSNAIQVSQADLARALRQQRDQFVTWAVANGAPAFDPSNDTFDAYYQDYRGLGATDDATTLATVTVRGERPSDPAAMNSGIAWFMGQLQADARNARPQSWQVPIAQRLGVQYSDAQYQADRDAIARTGKPMPRMSAYNPAAAGKTMEQLAAQIDTLRGNSFAGGAYGVARAMGADDAKAMQVATVTAGATDILIAAGSLRAGLKPDARSALASERQALTGFANNSANRTHRNLDLTINERGLLAQERAQAEAAGWKRPDGSTWWPPYDGAIPGTQRIISLNPATGGGLHLIDRYGKTSGYFVSPAGISLESRALSYTPNFSPSVYSVNGVIGGVERATITPWFGQRGLGVQYRLPDNVQYYLDTRKLGEHK
ncbi:MAG: TNT domain-containing protein [Lysobacter sp.]